MASIIFNNKNDSIKFYITVSDKKSENYVLLKEWQRKKCTLESINIAAIDNICNEIDIRPWKVSLATNRKFF